MINVKKLQIFFYVIVAIGSLFIIDCLDFASRWSGHFIPYKDNVERILYFLVLLLIIWRFRSWIADRINKLDLRLGGFSFLVEFNSEGEESPCDGKPMNRRADSGEIKGSKETLAKSCCLGQLFEIDVRNRLSKELGVIFSPDPTMRCGNMRVMFDGYAEKDGRVYVIEAKVSDSVETIRRAFAKISTFINRLSSKEQTRITFLLCVLTSKPLEVIENAIAIDRQNLPCDLQLRVYNRDAFEAANVEE